MITGVDIVQEQIHVAAGEKLRFRQKDVLRGHAIECRINAEDPYRFTPSPGQDHVLSSAGRPRHPRRLARLPGLHGAAELRLDGRQGDRLRRDAASRRSRRMRIALSEMVVEGIQTNIPLHRELLNDTRFLRGGVVDPLPRAEAGAGAEEEEVMPWLALALKSTPRPPRR